MEVLHPELLKVNCQEELSIFLACVCLKHCAFSCLVPLESTFSKASNSCKSLMERGVFGLGLFWFFSRHKINNPTTCFGGSLLRLKEGLDAHQGVTSPSEHCSQSLPLPWIQTQILCLTPLCTSAAGEERKEIPVKVEVTAASG